MFYILYPLKGDKRIRTSVNYANYSLLYTNLSYYKKRFKIFVFISFLFSDFILERDSKYILSSVLQKVIYSMMVSFDFF